MADEIINWNSVLCHEEFWKSYYVWEDYNLQVVELWLKQLGLFKPYDPDYEDPEMDGLPHQLLLTVPLRGGFGLEWSFYPPSGAASHTLYLLHPVLGQVEIGCTGGHFQMDTFRWDERQAIIDIAREGWQAGFEYRYFPPLLGAYLGTTPVDVSETNAAQLRAEWEELRLLKSEDIDSLMAGVLDRDNDALWEFDSTKGWVFSGGYSTRSKKFGEMSVFRAMREFLDTLSPSL